MARSRKFHAVTIEAERDSAMDTLNFDLSVRPQLSNAFSNFITQLQLFTTMRTIYYHSFLITLHSSHFRQYPDPGKRENKPGLSSVPLEGVLN